MFKYPFNHYVVVFFSKLAQSYNTLKMLSLTVQLMWLKSKNADIVALSSLLVQYDHWTIFLCGEIIACDNQHVLCITTTIEWEKKILLQVCGSLFLVETVNFIKLVKIF